MDTSSKSLGQQPNYTVQNTQSFERTEKIFFLHTRRNDAAALSASVRTRQCTGTMYKGEGRGNEAHRVPLPRITPKVQSPAVSGGAAMLGSAAARAIGLPPVSFVCFWKLKCLGFQIMTGDDALLRVEI